MAGIGPGPKTESETQSRFPILGVETQSTGVLTAAFQSPHGQEAEVKSQSWELNPDNQIWEVGVLITRLNACSPKCSYIVNWTYFPPIKIKAINMTEVVA